MSVGARILGRLQVVWGIFDADNFGIIHNRDYVVVSTLIPLESLSEIEFVKTRKVHKPEYSLR